MTTLTTLATLVLLTTHLQLLRQRRHAHARAREDALRARLKAQALALPEVEREYGPDSVSARYLRAATYITNCKLRTPRTTPHRAHARA